MKKTMFLGVALLLTSISFGEVAGQASPGVSGSATTLIPAPAPGSPAIFRSNMDLMAELERSIAEGGALSSTRITTTDEYRGSIVHRNQPNGAIAHAGNTELHYILEGSGTVVTGGTIVREEGVPARAEGGEARRVVKGDIIIIPAGSAHYYSQIDETITYLEWRFVAPD